MDAPRALRPIAAAFVLLLALTVAAPSAGAPTGPARTQAAGLTALFVDLEPDNVISYIYDPLESFVFLEDDIETVETGFGKRGIWLRYEPTPATGRGSWSFAFAAPKGQSLGVGTYTSAEHITYGDPQRPGISAQGQLYCFEAMGRFTIHEIGTTATGLSHLSASFRYKCSEAGRSTNPGWLYGEIRYEASDGFVAANAAPESIDFGSHPIGADAGSRDVTVTSLGTQPVTLGEARIVGQDETAFSVASNGCDGATLDPGGTCTVRVAASPHAARKLVARLKIKDDTYRGTRAVPLEVAGGPDPVWPYDWGSVGKAARKYTWTYRNGLGVTDLTKPRLQAVFVSPFVNGKWISDRGPRLGVYVTRKGVGGSRWSGAKRVNGTNYHGSRAALAASGKAVYVTWVGMKKYLDYDPKAPRVLFFRRNVKEGADSGWNLPMKLTSKTSRVGYPAIAATGTHVYVVWVASGSGKLMLATSHDRGRTFTKKQIGTARTKDASGHWGAPSIAADGDDVIVAWWPNKDITVKARISRDAGTSFTPADIVGFATWQAAVATRGGRFGVALATDKQLDIRLNEDGTWGPFRRLPRLGNTKPQPPALLLRGKDGVAVVYPACTRNCKFANKNRTESRLVWRYSDDDGEHWYKARTLAKSRTGRYANDSPSVVWPPGGRRAVLFHGWTTGKNDFRVYSVEGVAVDPASAGPKVELAVDEPMPDYPDIERPPRKRP